MTKTLLAALLAATAPASAEVWIGAEAPLAVATSEAQRGTFQPGLLPAGGLYIGHRNAALGLRLRAGFLRDGAPPDANRADPGFGGLASATLAGRVRIAGAWVELAGGGGITGTTLAPTFELAAGWSFTGDGYELGPSARYVKVVSTNAMDHFGSAELMLVGLDVRFGKTPARRLRTRPAVVVAPRRAPEPISIVIASDGDRVRDFDESCLRDLAGCPMPDGMEVEGDRIILDDRVLFDLNRARVRAQGRELVRAIADMWKANPTWMRITIEGHADVRGSDEHNVSLSDRRARNVRELMIAHGSPADAIEVVGYGRARPRDDGQTEQAHQRNRRVEFVIERSQP